MVEIGHKVGRNSCSCFLNERTVERSQYQRNGTTLCSIYSPRHVA